MRKILLCVLWVTFFLPGLALAVDSEFTMRVLVGDDLVPPTTPTLVSTLPIADSQIDITWTVATDDYLLGGYVLLRDGVSIATTTLTNYSDTGLTPLTLYEYEVYAFDWVNNISTTSNALATTTLPVPVVVATSTPITEGGEQSTQTVRPLNFSLTPDLTAATLRWETNLPTRYALRWGRTDAYTGGYIVNDVYLRKHQTTVTELEPGTVYQYELIGFGPSNVGVVIRAGEFKTKNAAVPIVMENVTRLTAVTRGDTVDLEYVLPNRTDIAAVRVVRSHLGYPLDIYDGAVVYEGLGTTVTDDGALRSHDPQYYSVFVIGVDGTISSGAVVKAELSNDLIDPVTGGVSSTPSVSIPVEVPDIVVFGFSTEQIKLRQAGKEFTFADQAIELQFDSPFTLSIPYDAVPPYLKSIIVTLTDPTDQRRNYSFLLRINSDGTAYEAIIAPLSVVGNSRLQVEIFDYERMLAGRYRVPVTFVAVEPPVKVFFPDAFISPLKFVWPILLGVVGVMSCFFFIVWRRRHKTEDNN